MNCLKKYLYNLATDRACGFAQDLIKACLFILSGIYGLIIKALLFFFRLNSVRLNCKVISVGNITLGGTGKTSLVALIAEYLKAQGYKVAILTRGYKKPLGNIDRESKSYQSMGDEPYMLSLKLKDIPVIVDKDRLRSAGRAIKEFARDTVILDDGFQQWRIAKDLDVVTLDASNPWGNQRLIPRGILREPINCLKRADVLILTKADLCPDINRVKESLIRINPQALIALAVYQPLGFVKLDKENVLSDKEIIKGETLTLVSGIADPGSFERVIKGLGAYIGLSFQFPDHHRYSQVDFDNVLRQTKSKNIKTVITTEKDAVKIKGFWQGFAHEAIDFLVLRVRLKIIENEERFLNRLLGVYSH